MPVRVFYFGDKDMKKKSFRLELKDIGDTGVFTGYASVFGNEDLQGDVVEPDPCRISCVSIFQVIKHAY